MDRKQGKFTAWRQLFEQNWFGAQVWNRKLYDGILPSLVMLLLTMLFALLYTPIQILFRSPGLLIYNLIVLAAGVYTLGRCVQLKFNEITRAWYGMIAGLLLWYAVNTAEKMGDIKITPEVGVVLLLLAALVTATLWKTIFPLGLKFFVLVFLVNWALRFWVGMQMQFAPGFEVFQWTYFLTGFIALSGSVFFLLWMLLRAESRIHHLWTALGVWFCALILMIVYFQMPL
ncbi:MAG: hypothetical protein ROW48_03195 [Bellilinea sp.]